jgi:hypothetical protein
MIIFCPFSSFTNMTSCAYIDDFLVADTIAPPDLKFSELRRDFHFDVSTNKAETLEVLSVVIEHFFVPKHQFSPLYVDNQNNRAGRNSKKSTPDLYSLSKIV